MSAPTALALPPSPPPSKQVHWGSSAEGEGPGHPQNKMISSRELRRGSHTDLVIPRDRTNLRFLSNLSGPTAHFNPNGRNLCSPCRHTCGSRGSELSVVLLQIPGLGRPSATSLTQHGKLHSLLWAFSPAKPTEACRIREVMMEREFLSGGCVCTGVSAAYGGSLCIYHCNPVR